MCSVWQKNKRAQMTDGMKSRSGINRLTASDAIPSPCVGLCEMNPKTDLCLGCYRTIGEITDWNCLEDAEKSKILEKLESRRSIEFETGSGQ